MSSWKGGLLSRAARLVLVQLVTLSIPAYTMNTCKLPAKTLAALEQLNRNFLWGDMDGHRQISSPGGVETGM